jgi:hypothetical protein
LRAGEGKWRSRKSAVYAGVRISRKRAVRLMQEEGLKRGAGSGTRFTTMNDHDQPVAANLLDRKFEAAAPNQRNDEESVHETGVLSGGRAQTGVV